MSDIMLAGPIGFRSFTLEGICQESVGHQHNFDHVTFVKNGALKVWFGREPNDRSNESKVYRKGEWFVVKKDVFHTMKAMEPNTQYDCMYWHRNADGEIVEHFIDSYPGAYV